MFYLMKSKYAIFSNFKVTKIERSSFLGDTRYKNEKVNNFSESQFFLENTGPVEEQSLTEQATLHKYLK